MPFDLNSFLTESFPSLALDGSALFYRWPVGIRFELGGNAPSLAARIAQATERATSLCKAVFASEEPCVVISQAWTGDEPRPSSLYLMNLYAFGAAERIGLIPPKSHLDVPGTDDSSPSTLSWAEQAAGSLNFRELFRGIANADHSIEPSIGGRVYFLNPRTRVILHMYDDRGLDVIATSTQSIRVLYDQFGRWILDYDRGHIDRVFLDAGASRPASLPPPGTA